MLAATLYELGNNIEYYAQNEFFYCDTFMEVDERISVQCFKVINWHF